MRTRIIAAGVAALALIPSLAQAQQTCEERRANRIAGTVVGGALGALAGSAVAGRGDRSEGAVIGGIAGAVIGNQVSKGDGDCRRAYGWYDNDGIWHANAVDRSYAQGYYDRRGNWIEGSPPQGGWDRNGRWNVSDDRYAQGGYRPTSNWRDAPHDVSARIDWLERRIARSRANGSLSRREAERAERELREIRRLESSYLRDGRLSRTEADALMRRLDTLNRQIR